MQTISKLWRLPCLVLLLGGSLSAVAPQPTPDPDAQAVQEFRKRAAEYVKLQKSFESKLPPLPDKASPEQIAAHHKALAEAMQAARADARPGDIICPAEAYLLRLIAAEMKGKHGASAKETVLKDGNPKAEGPVAPALAVNAVYPQTAPVSTMPPTLLLRLPPLPDELRYRFVGRHLILHDTKADLVADFILDAVP